jgi:hypothetical protein
VKDTKAEIPYSKDNFSSLFAVDALGHSVYRFSNTTNNKKLGFKPDDFNFKIRFKTEEYFEGSKNILNKKAFA